MDGLEPDVYPAGQSPETGATCHEGHRLLTAFGEAVRELMSLHEQQFQAVMGGDPEATRFDLLIHEAGERKQNLKYAYLSHIQSHGCMLIDESEQS